MKAQYCSINEIISRRFKIFFCYRLSLKNMYNIKTNFFTQKFKHILIEDESYFTKLVHYIHYNPAKHPVVKDWRNYDWSSYKRILTEVNSRLETMFLMK